MTRLSTLVLRHKRLVVLFWLTVTAAGLAARPKLSGHLSQQFTLPGQPAYQANLAILRSYGNGGSTLPLVGIVTAPPGDSIDAPAARRTLGHVFAQVAGTPRVRVASYASTGDPRLVSADGRTGHGLVFPPPSAQLEARDPDVAPQVAGALRHGLPSGWSVQVTGLDELASGGNTSDSVPGVLAEALPGALGALAVLASRQRLPRCRRSVRRRRGSQIDCLIEDRSVPRLQTTTRDHIDWMAEKLLKFSVEA